METTNHYLTDAPIGKLMMKFSIPCILSLLVSSLYNIVDQIFIGWGIGYLGNGATNVVFPITIIALAIALMIGDGCAAFLSICRGKKDKENAHRSAGNAIVMLVLCSIVLVVFFSISRDSILVVFGATENNIGYAVDYFNIIVAGIPFFIFTNGMNSIIRADGSPKFAMVSTFIGCIINIILDPIAIFVLKWGVSGAAIATIAGQIVSAALAVYYLFNTRSFNLHKNSFKIRGSILRKIIPLGISSFLTQISIVIIMGVMNTTLVKYGAMSEYGADIPMTVVGIVMKIFQIFIAFVVGIAAGCQPIVGYNYGAGHMHRVKRIYKTMIKAEIVVGVIATIAFECFPVQLISLFGSESGLYNQFATLSFRIFLSMVLICGIQKSTSIFLQSLGRPVMAMGLSLLRDFILSVPLVVILPNVNNLGVVGPLYSGPIADIISFAVAVVMIAAVFRKLDSENCNDGEDIAENNICNAI